MKNKIIWKEDKAKYSNGYHGFVGKWRIFGVHYDGVVKTENREKLTCRLPDLKSDLGNFKTIEEAKLKAKDVLKYWLEKLNS